jgi:hypothetical protein
MKLLPKRPPLRFSARAGTENSARCRSSSAALSPTFIMPESNRSMMIAEHIAFLPYQQRLTIQPEGRVREVPVQMKDLSPPAPQELHWHQEICGNRYLVQTSR